MKSINIRFYQMLMLFFIAFNINLGQSINNKILTNNCNCKNASSIRKKIKKVKSLGYSDINNSLILCKEIIDSTKYCCDSFMVQAIVMRSEVKQNSDIIDDSMIDELNHLLGRIKREQTPNLYFTVAERKASLLTSFPDHFDEAIKIIENLLKDKFVNQDIKNKLFLYINLSYIKINQNKFSDAIDVDHKMIEEGEKNSIEQFQLIGHNHLAAIYYALEIFDKALYHQSNAYKLCKKSDFRFPTIASSLGGIMISLKKYKESIPVNLDLLRIPKLSAGEEIKAYNGLIEAYMYLNKIDSAEYYLDLVEKKAATKNVNKAYHYYGLKGLLDFNKKKYSSSSENYAKGIFRIKNENPNDYQQIVNYYRSYYEALNPSDTFTVGMIDFLNALDTLNKIKNENTIIKYDIQFESEKKDKEILKLNQNRLEDELERSKLKNKNFELINESLNLKFLREQSLKTGDSLKLTNNLKNSENKTLKTEQSLQKAKITAQNKMLIGGGIGLAIISLLSLLLYRLSYRRKLMNETLKLQKDKIQLLNRELNHRVKNNLAFMTSLLEMQGRRTESAEAKQALIESESRLKALALVHSQLFRSDTDTEVNLKNYLEEIKEHLQDIFSTQDKVLNIETDFCDYTINAEDAMRLGLIVNELVTNSVKHAFTDIKNPQITIRSNINSDGKLTLNYSDNGPGISKTMGDNIKETSLGIKLIDLLRKQLGDRYVVVV